MYHIVIRQVDHPQGIQDDNQYVIGLALWVQHLLLHQLQYLMDKLHLQLVILLEPVLRTLVFELFEQPQQSLWAVRREVAEAPRVQDVAVKGVHWWVISCDDVHGEVFCVGFHLAEFVDEVAVFFYEFCHSFFPAF